MKNYSKERMKYLVEQNPALLAEMQQSGTLGLHLCELQRTANWEYEQLLFSGMDDQVAEQYVLQEYVYV